MTARMVASFAVDVCSVSEGRRARAAALVSLSMAMVLAGVVRGSEKISWTRVVGSGSEWRGSLKA